MTLEVVRRFFVSSGAHLSCHYHVVRNGIHEHFLMQVQRLRLISRSLLVYSPWYRLTDAALLGSLFRPLPVV